MAAPRRPGLKAVSVFAEITRAEAQTQHRDAIDKATARHQVRRVQSRRHGRISRMSTTAAMAILDHATETAGMRSNSPMATPAPTYWNVPERTNTSGANTTNAERRVTASR